LPGIFSLYFLNFNFYSALAENGRNRSTMRRTFAPLRETHLRGASFSQKRKGAKVAKIFLEAWHGLTI